MKRRTRQRFSFFVKYPSVLARMGDDGYAKSMFSGIVQRGAKDEICSCDN